MAALKVPPESVNLSTGSQASFETMPEMNGSCQGRVRGQISLSHPSSDSHRRKERVSKEMQE